MTFQSSQEILSYLLKPFVAVSVFMTFLIEGKQRELLKFYPVSIK